MARTPYIFIIIFKMYIFYVLMHFWVYALLRKRRYTPTKRDNVNIKSIEMILYKKFMERILIRRCGSLSIWYKHNRC